MLKTCRSTMLHTHRQTMRLALLLWNLASPSASFGLVSPSSNARIRRRNQNRQLLALASSNNNNHEIFVVNWEGCLADCVPWRTQVGIDAASAVWPDALLATEANYYEDATWLHNKLAAISHCLTTTTQSSKNHDSAMGYHCSPTCEYALAARLLLEEQALDGGESNGKSGKYASRYHPQDQATAENQSRRQSRKSRPLTVGEISVNWSEGGMIRDAVQTRYHWNYQDPVPILQQTIDSLCSCPPSASLSPSRDYDMPSIDASIREAVHACKKSGRRLIITIPHLSDVAAAKASLDAASLNCHLVTSAQDALEANMNNSVSLLVNFKETTREILQESPTGSTVYVIDSSWRRLQDKIVLFGDYIPRHQDNGAAKCVVAGKNLCLLLTAWACHPTQQAAATMNPWTRLIDATEFVEMLSARIVPSPSPGAE